MGVGFLKLFNYVSLTINCILNSVYRGGGASVQGCSGSFEGWHGSVKLRVSLF